MEEFIVFIRDSFVQIGNMLHRFNFSIFGLDVTLFELLIGFVVLGFIISVFWKGARA